MAGYDRRLKDWKFQADLAKKETEQLDKQIIAGEIRKQIAEADLENHQEQIVRAEEVEEFLKMKFTNQQLYSWMLSKLSSLYFQTYQMAYQMAKQAETAYHHELGPEQADDTFVQDTNWDSLKKGLLSGEHLQLDLRRMEKAYLDANRRDLEITKPISLSQLDAGALLSLRETGTCEFHIPELLFDLDFPGHYFRRVKAARVTIPCVAGPYTNVSATLRLMQSWTRREVPTDLPPPLEPDAAVLPQTAIATSTGSGDTGMFELNFRDERYLPFEGAGAIGTWELELPQAIRPFDYNTIADVVIHLSYSARDGGESFKEAVNTQLITALNDPKPLFDTDATMSRLFSLRHDFPDAWSQLVNTDAGPTRTCTLQLSKQHFPSFLDYAWQTSVDGIVAKSIKLEVKSLSAHLSPRGPLPDPVGIELNGETAPATGWAIPTFDLTGTGALKSTSIDNTDVVECDLIVDGTLRAEDWNDLYLLMDYDVGT